MEKNVSDALTAFFKAIPAYTADKDNDYLAEGYIIFLREKSKLIKKLIKMNYVFANLVDALEDPKEA